MKKWSSDRILGLTAMLVSLMTLLIFIYQTNLLRQQNYISILPYLAVSSTIDASTTKFQIDVINQGIGPAIIESIAVLYDGRSYNLADYEHRLFDALRDIDPDLDSVIHFSTGTLEPGMAIPANTSYNLVAVKNQPEDFKIMTSVFDELLSDGLNYSIVYKSIQNERWRISGGSEGPVKLR